MATNFPTPYPATTVNGVTEQPPLDPTNGELDDHPAEDEAVDNELEASAAGPGHVELRTIVMPGRHIVFVPNLKSGCTSLLWMLARLAGLGARRFERSPLGAVSRAMTIHTMSAWPSRYRWYELTDEQREQIAVDDSWLRFTTLRDPGTRLWSAWQSKLLLREPGFHRRFGDCDWFPRVPQTPQDVIDDFRAFVASLGSSTPPYDAHWAPQNDVLAASPPLNHIGRLESLDTTFAVLREHVGPAWDAVTGVDENKSLLGYHRGLYDEECTEIVNAYYHDDFSELGYSPLDPGLAPSLEAWRSGASGLLNGIAALLHSHERIEDLHKIARRNAHFQSRVEELEGENARLESWINSAAQSVGS